MYWDVKVVRPLSDYRIYVEIEDGREGIFDLKPYLDRGVLASCGTCITSARSGSSSAQ